MHLLLPLILALEPARAADAGYYHPDEVARQSRVFVQAAERMGPAFDAAQQELTRLSAALEVLDESMLLLGDKAPPELSDWATSTRRRVTGQFLRLQKHVDLLQEDYGEEFGAALDRALAKVGKGEKLRQCGATGVAAITGRSSCTGKDRNAELAAAVDADPALSKAVASINEVPWPEVGVEPRAWVPVSLRGTRRYVSTEALLKRYAKGATERRAEALEDALDPLLDEIEAGDAEAVRQGEAARALYARQLAEDGAILWEALVSSLEKAEGKSVPAEVGLCPVPPLLGGCTGEDVTRAVLDHLDADRRFQKVVTPLQ